MDVTFEDVFDVELMVGDVLADELVVRVGGDAGGGVVVEDGVENDGLFGCGVGDEVG